MEIKIKRKSQPNNELPKWIKKVFSYIMKIPKICKNGLNAIWSFFCKSKRFSNFVYVKLPHLWRKCLEYARTHRKKSITALAVFAVTLITLLAVTIVNSVNSDYLQRGNGEVKYAMVLQNYYTFDHSEETRVAIKLSWEDGAIDLNDGKAEAKITAKVYPVNLKDKKISWKSSNDSVAKIDNAGNIVAQNPGEVTLTAMLRNEKKSVSAKLSVRQPVTGIFMPSGTVTLYKGGSGKLLNISVLPKNATNQNVKWHSKNTKVARVDESGHVKPVGIGMTEVVATTEDGNFEAKCFVNVVNEYVEVQSLALKNDKNMTVRVGESINAIMTVLPTNARNKTLKWSTDDKKIATVSQSGKIRGVSVGEANITAQTTNGKSLTFTVSVTENNDKDPFNLDDTQTLVQSGGVTYTSYDMSFPQAVRLQMSQNTPPKIWRNGGSVNATEAETAEYMNPNNYYEGAYKYQFLDLSGANGVSEEALNEYLADKGVLKGMGKVFIEVAKEYNVSEVYLVAHACLESGNGKSQLASGVSINGSLVYNVFGIGAYDANAVAYGAKKAYDLGWTSVEKAIAGGAKWISENYINRSDYRQNTLYKMRWNSEKSGEHQYATDVGWAVKQAVSIEKIFGSFEDAVLSFDVPVYNGQIPPTINAD